MRSRWRSVLILLCACKAEIGGVSGETDAAQSIDAAIDAVPDAFGTFGPWSAPVLVPGPNSAIAEDDGTLSNSRLEMVYAKSDPALDAGRKHLYWTRGPSVTSMAWSAPVRLSFNLDGTADETPRFAADDKKLFFASGRAGGTGGLDIWEVTRPTVGVSGGWLAPSLVGTINSTATDKWCMPCSTGRYLMISSRAPSTNDDIYEGIVGGGAPTLVTQLTSAAAGDTGAFISADCLTAYFASSRSGTNRLYKATRATAAAEWNPPQTFDDFMPTGGQQEDPWISDDGKTFVFASNVSGSKDVYITTR